MSELNKIPKIIHYCWVGNAPKPKSVEYCIETWKKYCPDYKIMEWNESNYDFTKNAYMNEAYSVKKWGFVPDYARLDIVYTYGGVYLDTDVELIGSLDDLLNNESFMGFENTGDGEYFVNCGHGFGAVPNHPIIKAARDLYETIHFINSDGSLNMLPSPSYTTQTLKEFGLVQNNKDQFLDGMVVYSSDVLCPKNFRTGIISKTSRTVSIHHFTASWMDEKIKDELLHIQKINKRYGKRIGKYVLLIESVFQKYSIKEIFIKLPFKVLRKIKNKLILLFESLPYKIGLIKIIFHKSKNKDIVLLDTSIDSDNCGDQIIMDFCCKQLTGLINLETTKRVPTHRFLSLTEKKTLNDSKRKILCGTNILSGHMKSYGLWKLEPDIHFYKDTVLMGVGYDSSSTEYDNYTKSFFRSILSKNYYHSVRDTFTKQQLNRMGIKNVLYTGCPTMWNLSPEWCERIPHGKGENVIFTITDYCRNPEYDRKMIETLCNEYDCVYFWIQGENDKEYFDSLNVSDEIKIIPSTLKDFDAILKTEDIDYVGTRLHAGIRALSHGRRSIIISIDNRARAIANDTGLLVIERNNIPDELKQKINSTFYTKLELPWDNIEKWKQQFKNEYEDYR